MSTTEISSELSPLAQCGEDQGLSSDIGGFLSASCMETDVEKSDPFNSDNTLGFPEESSRFDTECVLSSFLVEGVPMQQTTDSSVLSLVSGLEGVGSCLVLSGASFLLYDGSSVQKPSANPVVQMLPSNMEFLGGGDLKEEQTLHPLSSVQLLTPSASVTQSHPVIIGNPSAASLVKSVLKEAAAFPSTSPAPTEAREAVSVPPVMILNPTHLSLQQSSSGIRPSPLLIQLPSNVGITGSQETEQLVPSMMSQLGSYLVTSPAASVIAGVGMEGLSAQCDPGMTSVDSHVSSSCTASCPSSVSTPFPSADLCCVRKNLPSHKGQLGEESATVVRSSDDSSSVTTENVISSHSEPSTSHSHYDTPTPPVTEPQAPRVPPHHPIVISCLRPENKGSKGMKQILEHFLQQNKANMTQGAVNLYSSQPVSLPLNTNLVDSGSPSATDSDVKPLVVSVSDLQNSSSASTITAPSLGRKSSSVVFILKRTAAQAAGALCAHKDSSSQSLVPDKTLTMVSSSTSAVKDEVDGSVTDAVNTIVSSSTSAVRDEVDSSMTDTVNTMVSSSTSAVRDEVDGSVTDAVNTALTVDHSNSSESAQVSRTPMAESCSSELNDPTGICIAASSSDTDSSAQYQWVQIHVPASLASEGIIAAASSGGGGVPDDIQKLIPLTVNEKFMSDICRPIIICIVQEDGLMKRVNINPVDTTANQEGEGVKKEESSVRQDTGQMSSPRKSIETKSSTSDCLVSPGSQSQPGSNPSSDTLSSTPVTPNPSNTSGESSSSSSSPPQTGSDVASPPIRMDRGLTRDKQYKCDLCTAVFSRLGNYTRHRKIHTLNLKEDNHFKCPHCERPFLQRCDMNRHMAVHTNQYPFRCQTCNKGYIRKSDLVVHERFHSKTRAFKCETCGRAFYQSGDLRRHRRFVHMEQSQLSCGHCHRKYASEVTLIRHIKTAHNDILLQSVAQHSQQQQ